MNQMLKLPNKCSTCGKKATKVFHKGTKFSQGDKVTFLCEKHFNELNKVGPVEFIKKHGSLVTYEITEEEAKQLNA